MQLAKKHVTALSALSMAAVATLGAKSAFGVSADLGMYYDNAAILSSQSTSDSGAGTPAATSVGALPTLAQMNAGVTTVTLTVGQVLEFGIDAAVTGVTYTAGGTGAGTLAQPTNYGMAVMNLTVNSSDSTSSPHLMTLNDGSGNRGGTSTEYNSTAFYNINPAAPTVGFNGLAGGALNGASATGKGNNTTGKYIPYWGSVADVGDSTPSSSEGVGTIFAIGAGDLTAVNIASTSTGLEELGNFGASAQNLANATDFVDSLQWQASATGTVTLSPYSSAAADSYWSQTNSSTGTAARFKVNAFATTDTINAIPQLVVKIVGASTGTGSSPTPLFSLSTAAPGAAFGSQITNGTGALQGTFTGPGASNNTLTVTGPGNGFYAVTQATGIKDASSGANGPSQGYVAANGFSPTTDGEIFALDIEVGGVQANAAQLSTLLTEAGTDGGVAGFGTDVTLSTTSPVPNPFPGIYNFFVDYNGALGDDFLGWDLASSNDSSLVGFTVSNVAVVPEPMSLGLLALGGVGLMARRNRRKA